jgi:predicted nucleic acid-binding protein
VKREVAFWDASALVPICVHEAGSRFARQQFRRLGAVVWWGTSVEVLSALCRLRRTRTINDKEWRLGKQGLDALEKFWREVLPGNEVRNAAARVLEKYELRAGDGFQLAAALVWCQGRTTRQTFVCGDERLSVAARAEGFSVVALPRA